MWAPYIPGQPPKVKSMCAHMTPDLSESWDAV